MGRPAEMDGEALPRGTGSFLPALSGSPLRLAQNPGCGKHELPEG